MCVCAMFLFSVCKRWRLQMGEPHKSFRLEFIIISFCRFHFQNQNKYTIFNMVHVCIVFVTKNHRFVVKKHVYIHQIRSSILKIRSLLFLCCDGCGDSDCQLLRSFSIFHKRIFAFFMTQRHEQCVPIQETDHNKRHPRLKKRPESMRRERNVYI